MRKILVIALCLAAGTVSAGEELAWFEMENCGMCKHMAGEPGLMENITRDVFVTEQGMMTVTVVTDEYADKYATAKTHMHEAGEKLMAGEEMPLCGYCSSFMTIMGTGNASMEAFETVGGDVMLVSSTDTETVALLHEHANRTMHEMELMSEGAEKGSR